MEKHRDELIAGLNRELYATGADTVYLKPNRWDKWRAIYWKVDIYLSDIWQALCGRYPNYDDY